MKRKEMFNQSLSVCTTKVFLLKYIYSQKFLNNKCKRVVNVSKRSAIAEYLVIILIVQEIRT